MNLREFIQQEIKTYISEDLDLDQAFNDAEPVEEGVMSELDILAKEAKDLKSFVKTVFKEFDNLPKNKETLKWLSDIYKDSTNESVNEGKKSKDDVGVRLVMAIRNNVGAISELINHDKKDPKEVMSAFAAPLLNSVKAVLKHTYKPHPADSSNADKLKVFIEEVKKFEKIVELLIKRPSKAGVKKLDDAWRSIWNHEGGARIGLGGQGAHADTIIESVTESTKYKVGQNTPVGKIIGTSVYGKGRKQEWFYDVQKPGHSPVPYSEKSLDKLMGESVNEGKKKLPKFKNIPSWANYVAQHSDGEWTWYEETPTMIKFRDGSGGAWKQDGNQIYTGVKTDGKDWDKAPTYYNVKNGKITESVNEVKKYKKGDKLKIKLKNGKEFDLTFDSYSRQTGMAFGKFDGDTKPFSLDTIKEEQIDEKLITFSNRAPYGQIVFMAGGAGSGKGFAIDKFIDAAGFKVRDVDEMKKAVGKLSALGKFSIDKWYSKYSKNLKPDELEHVDEFVKGKYRSISDVAGDLKNPNNVASLHYIVDAMGLKDKWVANMLAGKNNKETLPNLLFDITAKKVSSITSVIKPLIDAGYDAKNVHLIWVLTNYHLAVQQNKDRERVVPDDILLGTHEGAATTIWSILTKQLPKGLNGRIDVILNNRENTVKYTDSKGNEMEGAVKGFKSLPVKKQGGGILPEKIWKELLYKWVVDNGPKTIDVRKPLDQQMGK